MSDTGAWKERRLAEREQKLFDLRHRYVWFQEALIRAHAEGKIDAEQVRFLIDSAQPLLYQDGEPVLNHEGEPMYDEDAEPIYFGRAQAYSYVGDPPTHTVAGSMKVALQLLDRAAATGTVIDVLCADLSALHARELARAA